MKTAIGILLATAGLATLPQSAWAGALQLRNKYANCPDVSHEQIVQDLYENPEIPFYDFSAITEEIRDIYRALFEPPAIKIPFSITDERFEEPNSLLAGFIYYSQGDLFVQTTVTQGIYYPESVYNFATLNGNLYAWKTGAEEGDILTRFTGDTIELLDYFVDPALRGKIHYTHYLTHTHNSDPDEALDDNAETYWRSQFSVTETEEGLLTAVGDLSESFYSLTAQIELTPTFWISATGISSHSCYGCGNETPRGLDHHTVEVGRPIAIETIPAAVQRLPAGVSFEATASTAERYMRYWYGHNRDNYYADDPSYCEAS